MVRGHARKTYRFDTNLIAVDNTSRTRTTNGRFRRVSVVSIVCGRKSEPQQIIGPNLSVRTNEIGANSEIKNFDFIAILCIRAITFAKFRNASLGHFSLSLNFKKQKQAVSNSVPDVFIT